jgi:hypothetical protein
MVERTEMRGLERRESDEQTQSRGDGKPHAPADARSGIRPMGRLRDAALPVGLALGVILAAVGVILGNWGIVGLGAVLALAGYFSRPKNE